MVRILASIVIVLAVAALALGVVFVAQGVTKNNELTEAMRLEHIVLGIEGSEMTGQVIDTLAEAKAAGDIIREHRWAIATTYEDLLGGERFNPEDLRQLTYAQALNVETYLYLAVVAFGLVTITLGVGTFMIVTSLALGATGVVLLKLPQA